MTREYKTESYTLEATLLELWSAISDLTDIVSGADENEHPKMRYVRIALDRASDRIHELRVARIDEKMGEQS